MTLPDATTVWQVIDDTWPAASAEEVGGFIIRDGQGGGGRVSAARLASPAGLKDQSDAIAAMRDLGQTPLFVIRSGEDALDATFDDLGFQVKDRSVFYAAPIAPLAAEAPPPISTFQVWPPLAAQREVWDAGGIGPERRAVMHRAGSPKTTLLGRVNDRPAAAGYVGLSGDCVMLHALEVAKADRRQGLAALMTRAAAIWGQARGALWLTLVTTEANTAANALYTSLGMAVVGQYHYRIKPDA